MRSPQLTQSTVSLPSQAGASAASVTCSHSRRRSSVECRGVAGPLLDAVERALCPVVGFVVLRGGPMAMDVFGEMGHARRLVLDHLREVRQRFSLDAMHVVEVS